MAKKSRTEVFESLIADVDKLPNDMPQDFKYRKRGKDAGNDAESGRAPVKMQPTTQSKVEGKVQNVVNHMMETNNRFQTTQNTVIQQQTEINKDQLQQDRAQTSLLQSQQRTMSDMNETMGKLYLMLKQQNDKLTPKYQEKAANDAPMAANDNLGQPKDSSAFDGLGSLLGSAFDMLGGRRRRGANKPKRQERADKRVRERAGRGGNGLGRPSTAGSIYDKLKGMSVPGMSRARSVGGAIVDGFKNVKGNRFAKIGGAILAGGAAAWGGAELLKGGFGSVSEKYESGGRGVGTVSTGNGDHGGVSYGKHQLSSKSGTMGAFLRSEQGQKFAPYFDGLTPGSAAFNQVYNQIAKEREEEFSLAQSSFIQETHYDPAMRKLQKNGIDFENRSRALNELVFSTSTQYGAGGAPSKIMRALEGMDVNNMTDEQIITAIQDNKSANVGTDFRSSSSDVQQSVADRAQREKADLLAMLKAEQEEKAGVESGDVERLRAAAAETEAGTTDESVAEQTLDPSEIAVAQQAPIGVLPMSPEGGSFDPSTGVVVGGSLLAGAAAMTAERVASRRTAVVDPSAIKGKEALPAKAADALDDAASVRAAEKGAAKGATRGMVKGVPIVGSVLTAADAAMIMTDDTLTGKEKAREGAGLVGGTAGAIAGGKAGAAGGAAVGAGIGSFFFGAGAVPGAAIGGVIGGIGGSIAGYMGGEALGEAAFDKGDELLSSDSKPQEAFVAPDSPVGIFPMASAVPESSLAASGDKPASPIVTAAKAAVPKDVKPAEPIPTESQSNELAATQLRQDGPQQVDLPVGKTTLMVVPIQIPAKVDTDVPKSDVAATPVKTEPAAPSAASNVVDIGARAVNTAVGAVEKAPAFAAQYMSDATNAMVSSANAVTHSINNTANNLVGSAQQSVAPNIQVTPSPKQTTAAWSGVASATPQHVEKVAATHETPMAREAFTSVQNVNVDNNVQEPPANMQQPRMKANGIAEGNSVRPELKDVPPMIADFGIVFLNAGII